MIHDKENAVAIILGRMSPKKGGKKPDEAREESPDDAMHACAEELLEAIAAKDVAGVAAALKGAFHCADSMPHEEGEHLEEDAGKDKEDEGETPYGG